MENMVNIKNEKLICLELKNNRRFEYRNWSCELGPWYKKYQMYAMNNCVQNILNFYILDIYKV